ncbi:MAG: 2-hydroxyglutaryl-CoA dehydratase [Calditrichaeota bacterium]|nr:2-hydroxyglutaryl-CoA dehydratase [Calditrichota bacterium]
MKPKKFITAGIDVGSRTTKVVIRDADHVLGRSLIATGWTPDKSSEIAFKQALKDADVDEVTLIVATGYGRVTVPFADKKVTEITAHARGVAAVLPETHTLIDIGGQDSKAIIIENGGLVMDFAMNDRCAAGSGKFLEFLAMTMELSISEFAELAFTSENPVQISSICTVFAESEVLSLLAEGARRRDVAAGVHRSIALRVAQLAQSLHPQPPVSFSGGVAQNRCLVRELSRIMGNIVTVPEKPEFTGAEGAAIIAHDSLQL